MGFVVVLIKGKGNGEGTLSEVAPYGMLKKDYISNLRGNFCYKIASESTLLVILVVCELCLV